MNASGYSGHGVKTFWDAWKETGNHVYARLGFLRRGVERLRPVRPLPHSVGTVLFLCKGNVCRSPFAEVYFTDRIKKEGYPIIVKSAGIETTPGKPAHRLAQEVALQYGISLRSHATTLLFHDLVNQADLIFVMEVAQKDRVTRLYPDAKNKIFLLGRFCGTGSLDIDDPYSGTEKDFKVCFDRIKESCELVCDQLAKKASQNKRTQAGGSNTSAA
ncbi:hypothetical protein W02_12400 [Nitrospira sp. KM1]|uniref:arsenate reductase/protein-tyrosine-phosphatase family protein n=1 Tax=Nitrospira sp. KM1 TaxID=1936990 RepID=UPI0013A73773|nr:hypothetical protein [Nitrospira sp. KM1]BCA54100.1 hypothetical protein W02_12400 [Nitrospira sp. KM1]